jgi:hypothetical protein
MTRNPSKMLAVLCMGIVFMLGVSCQFHAAPHSHVRVAGDHPDHSEPTAASAVDDLSCMVAVVPDIGTLFSLPFFAHELSPPVVKRLAPAVELDIPPRFSI